MYKIANDKAQSGARRLKLADLQNGDLVLTDEQRRDSIKARLTSLEAKLMKPRLPAGARKILGQEKFQLQEMLRAIRPSRRCPGVEQFLLDVIRENVSKFQWGAWMTEAVRRKEAADAAEQPANLESC